MRRHAMDEWIDTGDEEGAAKAFDAMDERRKAKQFRALWLTKPENRSSVLML